MCKLEGITTTFTIVLLIIFVPLVVIVKGHSIVHIIENEVAELEFSYPCNTSRITLQYGNRAPSYSSANPKFIRLPSNQILTDRNESESNECSLHLTINPVRRNDAGTYILTFYDENGQYIDDEKMGLRVEYPPGKASCESSDVYVEEECVKLHCSAPLGNQPGQIVCYQNGMRLPPLTTPEDIGSRLNQIILARSAGLVYCCSSTLQQTKDRCNCKDHGLDPVQNFALDNITDPCPSVVSTTQAPTLSPNPPTDNSQTVLPERIIPQGALRNNTYNGHLVALLFVVTLILINTYITCIFNGVHYFKLKRLEYMYTLLDKCDTLDELRLRSSRSDRSHSDPTEITDDRTEM